MNDWNYDDSCRMFISLPFSDLERFKLLNFVARGVGTCMLWLGSAPLDGRSALLFRLNARSQNNAAGTNQIKFTPQISAQITANTFLCNQFRSLRNQSESHTDTTFPICVQFTHRKYNIECHFKKYLQSQNFPLL
jgi:hypothetical protein